MVWICANFPKCDSYVGCHPGTDKPLGIMANKELRKAKSQVHELFDRLWLLKAQMTGCSKKKARTTGYAWLAKRMGIKKDKCHIGMFDLEKCKLAIEVIRFR